MSDSVIFVFPSENGYKFHPSDTKEKSDILSALTASDGTWSSGISITPFVRASWIGKNNWLPKTKAVFIVGVASRGIQNIVHRGSNSIWVAAKVIPKNRGFSFSEADTLLIMKELLEKFTAAIHDIDTCEAFYEAIGQYVIAFTGKEKMKAAVDELAVRITDKDVAKSVSVLPMARTLRGIMAPFKEK